MGCRWIWLMLLALACSAPPAPSPEAPPLPPLTPKLAPSPPPAPACLRIARIQVDKARRVLTAYCARGAVVELTAAVGREPLGTKLRAGDMRTPEGRYRVSGDAVPSRFHAFLPIDYPSLADADRALAEGRIGARDHARIARAHREGRPPPGDTPLGGDIGLHGEGERWAGDSRFLDWTLGCIGLSDADLDFVVERVEPGVPVEIRP